MKRIVYRYLSGFAFGVMMLVLCFLLTFTFGGTEYYQIELLQIFKPNALLVQTVWAGILYVCITITLINTHEFLKIEDNDVTVQYLIMFMIHTIVIVFVSFLSQEYGEFGKGVYSLLFGLGMIILMIGTLADMLQNLLKMKKLNKKLFVIKSENTANSTKKLPEPTKTSKPKAKAIDSKTTKKTSKSTSKPTTKTSSKATKK